MFSLIENAKVVSVMPPKDSTGAAFTTEYINLKKAKRIAWIIHTGTMTSTSNQAVTINVADDASGTHSAAITSASTDLSLPYYYVNSGDTYTKTSVSSSTFNLTKSSDSKVFIIELDTRNQKVGTFVSTSVTYDAEWVALSVATPGAHACLASVVAIVSDLRYQSDSPPTVIA